jgi:hypothetical protein
MKKRILSLALSLAILSILVPARTAIVPQAGADTGPGGTMLGFPRQAYFGYAHQRVMPQGISQAQMNQDVIDQFAKIIGEFMVDFEPSRNDTMNNPSTFRMVLSMFGGTGPGIAGIGVTTSETHGYGMMILAYMAGSEEAVISPGVTTTNQNGTRNGGTLQIGGMKIKDVLKLCLPQSLRDAYGSRDVTVRDYYDAMFRTMNHFPASGGSGHHIAWALTSGTRTGGTDAAPQTTTTSRMRPFQEPLRTTSGPSTATDGSLDTTYAMLVAEKQWGANAGLDGVVAANNRNNYGRRARLMMQEIWSNEVDNGSPSPAHYHLRIGNWVGTSSANTLANKNRATRPSDFMLQHLRAFEATENIQINGQNRWSLVINATQNGMNQIYGMNNPRNGILPDFIVVDRVTGNWSPAPPNYHEFPTDGDHGPNSCRVPWRLGTDMLLHGTPNSAVANLHNNGLFHISNIYNTRDFSNIGSIRFNGTWLGSGGGLHFGAPAVVAAATYGTPQRMAGGWNYSKSQGTNAGRGYGAYINILCMITASGNWWCPATSVFGDPVPAVNVGGQDRRINAGEGGTVIFPVETTLIDAGTYPVTVTGLPAWATADADIVIAGDGSGELTLICGTSAVEGFSALTLTIDGVKSGEFYLTINKPPGKTAVGFVYLFTEPSGGSNWYGFNNTGPQIEFDVTRHGDHTLTLPAWPAGGNGELHTHRDIYLLQPTSALKNRLPVTILSITVNGDPVPDGNIPSSHTPPSNRWLVDGTIGPTRQIEIPGGFADSFNSLFDEADLELRTFYLAQDAFTIPTGAVVEITYRVGLGTIKISADKTEPDFKFRICGLTEYEQPRAKTITITNTGNVEVVLDALPSVANWVLTAVAGWAEPLEPGDTRTFTLRPAAGLAARLYNPSITITGSYDTSVIIQPVFRVRPLGDVDRDGFVRSNDVTLLRRYIALTKDERPNFAEDRMCLQAANMKEDGKEDGKIKALDITLLRMYIASGLNKDDLRDAVLNLEDVPINP